MIMTLLSLAFSSHVSFASNTYSNQPLPIPSFHLMTEDEYKAKMKIAKARKPAAAENDSVDYATAFSDSFKNLESQVIGGPLWQNGTQLENAPMPGIHTPYDIDTLLDTLETKYDSMSPDAQFVGAQLLALKPWRSFIYRVRPLFQNNSKFTDAYAIMFMRAMLAGTNTYLPTKEWKAGFAYITQPYPGANKKLINTEADLYNFVHDELIPAVNTLAGRVHALNFTKPIYFDNKLFYSQANFASNSDRFIRLGEAERESYVSGITIWMSGLYFSVAYNWTGMMKAIDSYTMAFGFNASLDPDSMTAKDRARALRSQPLLFTLRKGSDGTTGEAIDSSKIARTLYVDAVYHAKLSWTQLKRDANNGSAYSNLYDPRAFVPFTRILDAQFTNIENMTHNNGITSAIVAGETIDIAFDNFFNNPPPDMKAFLPIAFYPNTGDSYGDLVEAKSNLRYRDYNKGNPYTWNISAYTPYFPSITNNDGVRRAARVLAQSWGGWVVGMPFSVVVF